MDTPRIIQSNISTVRRQEGTMPEKNLEKFGHKTVEFANRILNTNSEDIIDFLKNNTKLIAQKGSNSLYSYKNFLLYRSAGESSLQLEKNLKLCKADDIAPKFVQFYQLGNNDFLSLLEISPGKITPYKQAASQVPESAKQKFKIDLQKLNNQGLINRKVFSDKDLYFVTENNNIIFADWSEIHFLSPEEKIQMNETLKNLKI